MRLTALSASRIKTFLQCPYKYYLTYVDKIDLGTNFGARHGTLIHTVIERYALGERNWEDVLLEEYAKIDKRYGSNVFGHAKPEEYLERKKKCDKCALYEERSKICKLENKLAYKFKGCGLLLYNRSVRLLTKFFDEFGYIFDSHNIGPENVEHKFRLECAPGKHVRGYIDLHYFDQEAIHLFDWKTSKKYEPSQNYKAIKSDIQSRLYGWALREIYPNNPTQSLTFHFFNNRPITVWYKDFEIEKTRQYLCKVWDDIEQFHASQMYRVVDQSTNIPNVCKHLCNLGICNKKWKDFQKEH